MDQEIEFLRFKNLDKYEDRIKYVMTTRCGGVSPQPYDSLNFAFNVDDAETLVEENYDILCEAAAMDKEKIVYSNQSHTDVAEIVDEDGADFRKPIMDVDAFITIDVGVPISVRFADCQGVLIFAPDKNVVAAIHSGWKGNAKNIIGKTVRKMIDQFYCDPKKIVVAISPSLGPCCAEFGDPKTELPEEMHPYIDGKYVDLWRCSHDQLMNEGVLAENIENHHECTKCNQDKYFSYRGACGVCGRMVGLIMLKHN